MDRMPKIRRRICRSSSISTPSVSSCTLLSPPATAAFSVALPAVATAQAPLPAPNQPVRRPIFRGLRLPSSSSSKKRARSQSASPNHRIQKTMAPPESLPPLVTNGIGNKEAPHTQSKHIPSSVKLSCEMPSFLKCGPLDIEAKYQELMRLEKQRLLAALDSDDEDEDDEDEKEIDAEHHDACDDNTGGPLETPIKVLLQQDSVEPPLFRVMHTTAPGLDRYYNIKPWAHNCVQLQVPPNTIGYVNASPIVLRSPTNALSRPLRYIAMQAPTEQSLPYVWRMVAEQTTSPSVIVQLTNMFENNMLKCYPYFPIAPYASTAGSTGSQESLQEERSGSGGPPTPRGVSPDVLSPGATEEMEIVNGWWQLNKNEDTWGDGWSAQLRTESLESLCDGAVVIRKLLLRVTGETEDRVVWHMLFTRWPDFGVPSAQEVGSFLLLMQLSREYNAGGSPRIIHCSAGVGRTGTFIALEHLLQELDAGRLGLHSASNLVWGPASGNAEKNEGAATTASTSADDSRLGKSGVDLNEDLIYKTVNCLREQRRAMVQGEVQYAFIYSVLRQMWEAKYEVFD